MNPHRCRKSDVCRCYPLALEPNERCPLHGCGDWPPRCGECGRFIRFLHDIEGEAGKEQP
jgi:hypothetical protein